jgi:hypothetical protein
VKLVIDASVAVAASANPLGFERFRRFELVAPPLMWIESLSTLHAMKWRGELRPEQAEPMRDRLLAAPVSRREPVKLSDFRGQPVFVYFYPKADTLCQIDNKNWVAA